MASQTLTGGTTINQTHYTGREFPYLTGFPSLTGAVTSVSLSGYVRFNSDVTSATVYPVIFKTFTIPTTWVDESTRYRQNTNNGDYYITVQNWRIYCSNDLINCAEKTISYSNTGNQAFSFTFTGSEITTLGKDLSNWTDGKLIIGLLPEKTGINWGNNTSFTLTVNYDAGSIVYYYDGSSWVKTIPYYYTGSEWKACQAYYYNGSSWVHC